MRGGETTKQSLLDARIVSAFALVLLLSLSALIRVSLIKRELPGVYHPDEPTNVRIYTTMLANGDPNPHFFGYPSLMFYLHALPYLPRRLLHLPFEFLPLPLDPSGIVTQGLGITRVSNSSTIEIGRSVTVIIAIVGVYLVYITARTLTESRVLAYVAAILLALSPTFYENSVYITPDVPAATAVALVIYLAVRARQNPGTVAYVLAGASVGLAMSLKYNALLVAISVVVVGFQNRKSSWIDWRALWAGPAALLAFLLTTPFALLDPVAFARGAAFEVMHYRNGHLGMQGASPEFYASYLWGAETALVLAVFFSVPLLYRRSRDVALLLAFPVLYGLSIANLEVRNNRTAILLIPPLCLLVSVVIKEYSVVLGRRTRSRPLIHTGLVVASLLLGVGLLASSAAHDKRLRVDLLAPENRQSAQTWVYQHVPAGSSVLDESYAPWLDPRRYIVSSVFTLDAANPKYFSGPEAADYVITTDMRARFEVDPAHYKPELERYDFAYSHMDVVATFDQLSGSTVTIFKTRGDEH